MKPATKKRFGQHFLTDKHVLSAIIRAAELKSSETVLEIGPGRGVMSQAILDTGASLKAVEIDRDLAKYLRERFEGNEQFELIEQDVLKLNFAEQLGPEPIKLVANLPYNVSTPIFFALLKHRQQFKTITIMVQKEVGERLLHKGETKPLKDYGILSVASALCFDSRLVCHVGPKSFSPPPKVDSVVLQLTPRPALSEDEAALIALVRWGFAQRRKLLLSRVRKERPEDFERLSEAAKLSIEGKRPENLSPSAWEELYRELNKGN